jgi:hypothetical protein
MFHKGCGRGVEYSGDKGMYCTYTVEVLIMHTRVKYALVDLCIIRSFYKVSKKGHAL